MPARSKMFSVANAIPGIGIGTDGCDCLPAQMPLTITGGESRDASGVDLDLNADLLCDGGPEVDRRVGRLD